MVKSESPGGAWSNPSRLEEQADGGEDPLVGVHAVERFDLVNQRSLMCKW
jgi:hypothetical protein